MTASFVIENIHCPSCIRQIEADLARLPGLRAARLNFTTRRLLVDHDEAALPADRIVARLADLGFRARPFGTTATPADQAERQLLRAMAVAGFAAANVMLLSVAVWSGHDGGMGQATRDLLHWISGLIALPAIGYAGRPFFASAWAALRHRSLNMDVPISLAVLLAAGMSVAQSWASAKHAYFDAAVMLLFFLLIGRYLDARLRARARDVGENLLALRQDMASVIGDDGQVRRLAADLVRPGMRLLVGAGERLPADGRLLSREALLDTAILTGESLPRRLAMGDPVHAGMLNHGAAIEVEATRHGDDSRLAQILALTEQALTGRSRYVRLADRAARHYAPAIHLIAGATLLGWLLAGAAWPTALMTAIAVLIITCPCALGLAVPAVQVVATKALLAMGVLLRNADALERIAEADIAVFDKTGTLTLGAFSLAPDQAVDRQALAQAARLAVSSRHPLAQALVAAAEAQGLGGITAADDAREQPGQGVAGVIDGVPARLGRAIWCGVDTAAAAGDASEIWFRLGEQPAQCFAFHDQPRPGAAQAIAGLRAAGLEVMLLSGDRPAAVATLAARLGIDDWHAGLAPEDKLARLDALAGQGRRAWMIGDGINDAPALARAHASLSPANAADISQNSADFILEGDDLSPLPALLAVARRARRLMLGNFALAAGYNLIAVPIAVAGLVTPLIAAVAMSASSLIVTANALRLRPPRRSMS
ncbi:MAG: heavy metal translocating P-type ATPase metal-binding domain-containing protein [Sphingomonadales bacterium]